MDYLTPETGESGFCAMIQRKVRGLSVKHRGERGSQRDRERPNHVEPWSHDKEFNMYFKRAGTIGRFTQGNSIT